VWTRLGLRARVTVMFGLGALLLSVLMGGLSYFTTRHFLLAERQSASLHQAFSNATVVRTNLVLGSTQFDEQLASLDIGTGSESVMYVRGKWYSSRIAVGEHAIPAALRTMVLHGEVSTVNEVLDGSPEIVVGVPLVGVHAAYFELFDVSDLGHILRVLGLALFAAGFITTVLGAAVGLAASGRSLRPLATVSSAAVAIADGRLDTRLPDERGDPDLAPLTGSFNRMVDQLQERIERDARFTSDVSHELRSPLTTMANSLEVLEAHRDELSTRPAAALRLLSDDLHRFQRMVADLLEMSRAENGTTDMYAEEVEAGELVRRSVAAAGLILATDTPLPEVHVDPAAGERHLRVDKRRFERVIVNLLENAALYGGGATAVTLRDGPVTDGVRTLEVVVDDAGPGVPASERTKVFERFYRGQASGRRGVGTGTGLGLSLVAEHVRLNGGRVWVEDAPGGGARFVVQLPAADEEGA
jgi:signal transduction histidine kinase